MRGFCPAYNLFSGGRTNMIYEINQMIDHLDDFFKSSHKETIVGGIAGTQIEKFALDSALNTTNFGKILVINGCQDYLGIMKKPMQNVKFWGDLFVQEMVDPLIPYDPWKPHCFNPRAEYVKRIDVNILKMYDIILIFNAHLVPTDICRAISENFAGQIVYVVDPVECGMGRSIMFELGMRDMPVVVDHLEKVSPMIAMARQSVGFDSRAVDHRVKGTLNEVTKFSNRSIGKIDDKMYMTNDHDLYYDVMKRQREMPFRKNQRVIVNEDIIDVMMAEGERKASLVRGSMLVIDNPSSKPLMKLRLYNSKTFYAADVTYASNIMKPQGAITVYPGNIMNFEEDYVRHRYNHTILIMARPISKTGRYSIFKNSNNVTIVNRTGKK